MPSFSQGDGDAEVYLPGGGDLVYRVGTGSDGVTRVEYFDDRDGWISSDLSAEHVLNQGYPRCTSLLDARDGKHY